MSASAPSTDSSLTLQDCMDVLVEVFSDIATDISRTNLLPEELAPDGLMRKARSVSWLVEQVYLQQFSRVAEDYGFTRIEVPQNDLISHDLLVEHGDCPTTLYVNLKTGDRESGYNKNDVTKADKLASFYHQHRDDNVAYVLVDVRVDFVEGNRTLVFLPNNILAYNVAWLPQEEIYVNGRNHNLQARLDKPPEKRSRDEFVMHLIHGEKGILEKEPKVGLDDSEWNELTSAYSPENSLSGQANQRAIGDQ